MIKIQGWFRKDTTTVGLSHTLCTETLAESTTRVVQDCHRLSQYTKGHILDGISLDVLGYPSHGVGASYPVSHHTGPYMDIPGHFGKSQSRK